MRLFKSFVRNRTLTKYKSIKKIKKKYLINLMPYVFLTKQKIIHSSHRNAQELEDHIMDI